MALLVQPHEFYAVVAAEHRSSQPGQYTPDNLGQDPTHANLIAGIAYGTGVNLIPVPWLRTDSETTKVGGGNGALFYYYNAGYMTGDFLGNTDISTQGVCCVTGSDHRSREANGNGNILLETSRMRFCRWPATNSRTCTSSQAVRLMSCPIPEYIRGGPVPYGRYINPVGISVDSAEISM